MPGKVYKTGCQGENPAIDVTQPMEKRRRRWPRREFVALLLTLYLGLFAALNCGGSRAQEERADFIIVPGARVQKDGQPGPSLHGRLEHAAELYKKGLASHIVCTGGRGDSGHLEAEASRDFLVDRGVPAEAVVLEDMSHTTWENFAFAVDETGPRGWTTCLVVTDPFHMLRCLAMAREVGLQPLAAPAFGGPGWKRPGSMVYYTTREMAAWVKYLGEAAGRP